MTTGGSAVTGAQLLAAGLLSDHEVLGGDAGLDRPVRMVVPGTSVHELPDRRPGSLVVFGREQLELDDLAADLAVRLARSAGLAGLVAPLSGRPVPLVTRRLADRLAMPLIGVRGMTPAEVVAAFDPYVRAPEIAGLRVLGTAAERFRFPPADTTALVRMLTDTLGGPVVLTDAECRYVAGDRPLHEQLTEPGTGVAEHLARPAAVSGTFRVGESDVVLVAPVQPGPSAPAGFWIAARLRATAGVLLEPIRQALTVAALSFAVRVAGATADLERESRQRAALLADILEHADAPPPRSVERAAALGWRLAGRHTAVHLALGPSGLGVRTAALIRDTEEQLRLRGIEASLVERPDGWAFWITEEPGSDGRDPRAMSGALRGALGAVERQHEGLLLCAGIGRSRPGTRGIERSLEEAHQACMLARTQDRPAAVEHVDTLSAKRLLVSWYGSQAPSVVAGELLGPLLETDSSGELVRTLRRFLDCESSATEAAAVLGVHRNTVMQRMERVVRLLEIDLDDPDNRLAVHLAARSVDLEWPDPG